MTKQFNGMAVRNTWYQGIDQGGLMPYSIELPMEEKRQMSLS